MNMMKSKSSPLRESAGRLAAVLAVSFLTALPLIAQTDITTTINQNQSLAILRIAIPSPTLGPSTAEAGAQPATFDVINPDFFAPLTRDIAASGVFAIAPLPPNINPASPDLLKNANAQLLLKLNIFKLGDDFVIEVRMADSAGATQYGKRYRGQLSALSRIAHTIANEMVRAVNGKPGIFLSQIASGPARSRSGSWTGTVPISGRSPATMPSPFFPAGRPTTSAWPTPRSSVARATCSSSTATEAAAFASPAALA